MNTDFNPTELQRARRMAQDLSDATLLSALKREGHELSPEALKAIQEELERRRVRIPPWDDLAYFPVTTLPSLDGFRVTRVLGVVGAQHPVFMSAIREALVPLISSHEQRTGALAGTMGSSRETCLGDLATEARRLMADAVLGVTLQMTEWQGGDKPLIMLQAVGTAVQLETIP